MTALTYLNPTAPPAIPEQIDPAMPHLSILLVAACTFLISCSQRESAGQTDPDSASSTEQWMTIFNGENLAGWTPKFAGYPAGENPRNTFRVEDGMLRVVYADYDSFDNLYGHLYWHEALSRYKLRFEYRFTGDQTPGGADWNVRNSGVMFHSQSAESNELDQDFPVSVEMQLLGGLGNGPRTTGNVCTPGTAVVRVDSVDFTHCINSTSKTYDGDGWIRAEAVVLGGEEMHFLIEGDTVLSFREPQLGGDMNTLGNDGKILTEGYVALQAESHPIDFRNIQLLKLVE